MSAPDIYLEPTKAIAHVVSLESETERLDLALQRYQQSLSVADHGDPRGYLGGGLNHGYAALSTARQVTVDLTAIAQRIRMTVDALIGHDQNLTSPSLSTLTPFLLQSQSLLGNSISQTPRSADDLAQRAQTLFERFEDDGFLWLSSETRLAEIEAVLSDLRPTDIAALEALYLKLYSPQRDGRTLMQDVLLEVDNAYERYRVFQLLYPDQIISQAYPTAEFGPNEHIVMQPAQSVVMAGMKVDYSFDLGNVIYDPNKPPRIRSFVINDPAIAGKDGIPAVVEGPHGTWEDAHWTLPGTHTIVYEVQYDGQPSRFYSMQQTVVMPEELAALRLKERMPGLPPHMYLNVLQYQLEQLRSQDASQYAEQIALIQASIDNATQLLAPGGDPIQAVLIASENGQSIPLNLYLQSQPDGSYAILDLTNPHPDAARTYRGITIEEAWQDFLSNNTLPAGQIAAIPPALSVHPNAAIWNAPSDGKSTLEQWSDGLSMVSLLAFGAGVVLMFIPGGQIPGGVILGTMGVSIGAGAIATGLSMADRAQYGNLTWNTQTKLEVLDLASNVLAGGALVRTGTRLTVRQVGKLGVALEMVETGTDLTSTLILSKEYYDQIQAIQADPTLSDIQKHEAIQAILRQAATLGGLLLLGVGLSKVDFSRIHGAVNLPDIPLDLRDAINGSPVLQQTLASQNYDPKTLQSLWQSWKQMQGHISYSSFDAWIVSMTKQGISPTEVHAFLQLPNVQQAFKNNAALLGQLAEHPEYIKLALNDPIMMERLLLRPNVSPLVPIPPQLWRDTFQYHQEPFIQFYARSHGLTVSEYTQAVDLHLTKLVENANMYTRVEEDILTLILQDGRFKSQFETGTSGGALTPHNRMLTERLVFGFNDQQPVTQRPIYGYLSSDNQGGFFSNTDSFLGGYGSDVAVRLKSSVRERTTFTLGDSLDFTSSSTVHSFVPEPLSTPSYQAADYTPGNHNIYAQAQFADPLNITSISDFSPYMELQFHGGLTIDDIEEVIFKTSPDPDLIILLNNYQIPWRIVTSP